MASAAWVEQQRALLELERAAEAQQLREKLSALSAVQCQQAGLSVLQLRVDASCTSLYGRITFTLMKRDDSPLPAHQMKAGDEAEVHDPQHVSSKPHEGSTSGKDKSSDSHRISGVVSKVTPTSIDFVCDDAPGDEGSTSWLLSSSSLRLDMRSSEATHKKLTAALDGLLSVATGQSSKKGLGSVCCEESTAILLDLLFQKDPSRISTNAVSGLLGDDTGRRGDLIPFNQRLNQSQLEAITFALNGPSRISLIHGPPGTGKTTAVTELILQALIRGKKVLVCAPSNVAVDNILERLVAERHSYRPADYCSASTSSSATSEVKVNAVRIGHPARISNAVHRHCLDALVLHHEGTEIVQDVRKDIDTARKQLSKINSRKDRSKKRDLQVEIRVLRKEARRREDKVMSQIMTSRNVVLATCVGAASRLLRDMSFDLVVVDEAAQALEAACWIPLTHCRGRVVLAGDHCQLPPTIKSTEAASNGLAVTLFERIIHHPLLHSCARLLDTQYRMNELISSWASKEMYENRLVSHSSNATHTLRDLCIGEEKSIPKDGDDLSEVIMMLVDTAGCDMDEEGGGGEGGSGGNSAKTALSYRNSHEADIVYKHIQHLYAIGLAPDQIGVITPYNGQLECLRDLLHQKKEDDTAQNATGEEKLEIRTVDGFQGGEKEAIIISLVRSNAQRQVGFLAEKRRINVAVTRAKRHLMVVCDSDTVSSDPFIKGLLEHISSRGGEHRSALEYVDPLVVPDIATSNTLTAKAIAQLPIPPLVSRSVTPNTHFPPKVAKVKAVSSFAGAGSFEKDKQVPPGRQVTAGGDVSDRDEMFRHNITTILKLLATTVPSNLPDSDNNLTLSGGAFGPAALRRLYANPTHLSSSGDGKGDSVVPSKTLAKPSFREFITPHSQTSRLKIKTAIDGKSSSLQWPQDEEDEFFSKLLVFPPRLNSHERHTIHSVAEELNETSRHPNSSLLSLYHESFDIDGSGGNAATRQLLVSCRPFDSMAPSQLPSIVDRNITPEKELEETAPMQYAVLEVVSESEGSDVDTEADAKVNHPESSSSKKKKKTKKKSKKLGGEGPCGDSMFSRIGGKKDAAGSGKISQALKNDDIDELALLEMTISENEKMKEYNKYRVGFRGSMPNYEKTARSEALQAKIQKAREVRCADPSESTTSSSKKKKETKKKKPPPSRI